MYTGDVKIIVRSNRGKCERFYEQCIIGREKTREGGRLTREAEMLIFKKDIISLHLRTRYKLGDFICP